MLVKENLYLKLFDLEYNYVLNWPKKVKGFFQRIGGDYETEYLH